MLCMPHVWFDDDAFEQLLNYVNSSKGAYAPNTERARLSDSRIFAKWCQDERKQMLPSRTETIAAFIDAMAEMRAPFWWVRGLARMLVNFITSALTWVSTAILTSTSREG